MSASYSESSSSQNTTQIDKRVTTDSGDILSLADNTLTVNEGGALTVINKDPEAAYRAIDAIKSTTIDIIDTFTDAASEIVQGSNNIAAKVAESQEQFVATASGQKWGMYAVLGAAALVILPALITSRK